MLRAKTPQQRFAMMTDLVSAQYEAMKAGIKFQNPKISDVSLEKLFRERVRKTYSLKH